MPSSSSTKRMAGEITWCRQRSSNNSDHHHHHHEASRVEKKHSRTSHSSNSSEASIMTWRRQRTSTNSKSADNGDFYDEESGFLMSENALGDTKGGTFVKKLRSLTASFRAGTSVLQHPPAATVFRMSLFMGLLLVGLVATTTMSSTMMQWPSDRNLATHFGGWFMSLGHIKLLGGHSPFGTSSSAKRNLPCDPYTSAITQDIIIDVPKIKALDTDKLTQLRDLTEKLVYARRMVNGPGRQHYRLLQYLTEQYGDCRHVVDVGTGSAASALALGAGGVRVETFDLPSGIKERQTAYRDKTEQEWYAAVLGAGVEVEFHNLHLLRMPQDQFVQHMNSTWLIFIDTVHLPYSKPFERQLFDRLMAINYKGLVVLDEIHGAGTFGGELERWWYELQDHAEERGYTYFDVSDVGHFTGTGIIDFSGRVKMIEEKKQKKQSWL